jgi:hypothetical protein
MEQGSHTTKFLFLLSLENKPLPCGGIMKADMKKSTMQLIILNILRKVAIFLVPLIINWIWEKKVMKGKENTKSFDKKDVIHGKILR